MIKSESVFRILSQPSVQISRPIDQQTSSNIRVQNLTHCHVPTICPSSYASSSRWECIPLRSPQDEAYASPLKPLYPSSSIIKLLPNVCQCSLNNTSWLSTEFSKARSSRSLTWAISVTLNQTSCLQVIYLTSPS